MRTRLIRCVWLLVGAALLFAAPQPGAGLPAVPFRTDHWPALRRAAHATIFEESSPCES